MKYLRKKKKNPMIPVLITLLCVLLAIALVVVIVTVVKNGKEDPADQQGIIDQDLPEAPEQEDAPESDAKQPEQAPEEDKKPQDEVKEETKPEEEETPTNEILFENGQIETTYGVLHYPEEWADYLKIEIDRLDHYCVKFFAEFAGKEPQLLFNVCFGSSSENTIGTVETSDGSYVSVAVEYAEFTPDDTWSKRDSDTVYAMQEAANDLIDQLPLTDEPSETIVSEDVIVETPYCNLVYPGKWAEILVVEQDEETHTVHFYGNVEGKAKQLIFSVYFGGEEGDEIATVKDENGSSVSVRIAWSELEFDDSWSEGERNTLYAMQEDVNYLIDALLA